MKNYNLHYIKYMIICLMVFNLILHSSIANDATSLENKEKYNIDEIVINDNQLINILILIKNSKHITKIKSEFNFISKYISSRDNISINNQYVDINHYIENPTMMDNLMDMINKSDVLIAFQDIKVIQNLLEIYKKNINNKIFISMNRESYKSNQFIEFGPLIDNEMPYIYKIIGGDLNEIIAIIPEGKFGDIYTTNIQDIYDSNKYKVRYIKYKTGDYKSMQSAISSIDPLSLSPFTGVLILPDNQDDLRMIVSVLEASFINSNRFDYYGNLLFSEKSIAKLHHNLSVKHIKYQYKNELIVNNLIASMLEKLQFMPSPIAYMMYDIMMGVKNIRSLCGQYAECNINNISFLQSLSAHYNDYIYNMHIKYNTIHRSLQKCSMNNSDIYCENIII